MANGSPSAMALANWTRINCTWLDEIYGLQNHLYWQHLGDTTILVIYCLVCAVGACANLTVLAAFARAPALRANLRNYFIANLAVSDLLLCTVTAPATLYLTTNLFWPFGSTACQLAVNLFVSCLTLVLIALDRVLLTICPVKWRLAATAPLFCYSFVWLMSLLVAAPYFFAVSADDVHMFDPWDQPYMNTTLALCGRRRPQICLEKTWHRLPISRKSYTLAVLAVQYLLPVAALAFSYSQIGSTIHRRCKASTTLDRERRQLMTQRNRRALLLLLMLVMVYAIAWLPINAYHVLSTFEVIEFSQYRYLVWHLIGISSACLNPIMYAAINENFRAAIVTMLRPLFCPGGATGVGSGVCCCCCCDRLTKPRSGTAAALFHPDRTCSLSINGSRGPRQAQIDNEHQVDQLVISTSMADEINGAFSMCDRLLAPTEPMMGRPYHDDNRF